MGADPTWPNRAGYSIPCAVTLGSAGGVVRRELSRGSGACGAGAVRESGSVFCRVFSLSVLLLFLFPLFAVLLNYPYLNPPVSACFFPFSSTPRRGEGRPRGAFVTGCSQTRTSTLLLLPAHTFPLLQNGSFLWAAVLQGKPATL